MKTAVWVSPIAAVVIGVASIGVAQLSGGWVVNGREAVVAGQSLAAADIKGWMTFQQVADGVGRPVETVIALAEAPAGVVLSPSTALRDVEAQVPGFDLPTFRERVTALAGGGAPTTGETPTPTASHSGPGSGSSER